MNNIPLHVYATMCLSIQLLMHIWLFFILWLLWIKLLWTFIFSVSWINRWVEFLSYLLSVVINFLRFATLFSKLVILCTFSLAVHKSPICFLHPSVCGIVSHYHFRQSNRCIVVFLWFQFAFTWILMILSLFLCLLFCLPYFWSVFLDLLPLFWVGVCLLFLFFFFF